MANASLPFDKLRVTHDQRDMGVYCDSHAHRDTRAHYDLRAQKREYLESRD
jgi:hypothetical protein